MYPQIPVARCGDCVMYDEVGWNVATGKGFVDGFSRRTVLSEDTRGPGAPEVGIGPVYPAFLGVVFRLFGHDFVVVRIIQAVIGAAAAVLVFLIMWELGLGQAAGIAGYAVALSPPLVMYAGMVLTESIFVTALVLVSWTIIRAANSASVLRFAVAGGVTGLTILLREETVLVALAYSLLVLWMARSARARAGVFAFLAITACIVGSWTV